MTFNVTENEPDTDADKSVCLWIRVRPGFLLRSSLLNSIDFTENLKPDLPPSPGAPLPLLRGKRARCQAGGVGNAAASVRRVCGSAASLSRSPLSDPPGAATSSTHSKAADLRLHRRTDPAGSAAGTDPARLASSFPRGAGKTRTEARSVRSTSRRPPARIPLFSLKMDGFTGSLGESRPPLAPTLHLVTCPCSGGTAGAARATGGFTRVTAVFICTAPPAAAEPQNQALLLRETLQRPGPPDIKIWICQGPVDTIRVQVYSQNYSDQLDCETVQVLGPQLGHPGVPVDSDLQNKDSGNGLFIHPDRARVLVRVSGSSLSPLQCINCKTNVNSIGSMIKPESCNFTCCGVNYSSVYTWKRCSRLLL